MIAGLLLIVLLQGSPYLESIEVAEGDVASPRILFSDLSRPTIVHALELGELIEGRTLVLHPKRGVDADLRVYFQFETSLTVMDEGPHLDLLDWEHHTSEWRRLAGDTAFSVPLIGPADRERFPPVTPEEVYRAVLERGGERWAERVRDRAATEHDPVAVGVSKIRLRITVVEDGEERELHTIEFDVPLGC